MLAEGEIDGAAQSILYAAAERWHGTLAIRERELGRGRVERRLARCAAKVATRWKAMSIHLANSTPAEPVVKIKTGKSQNKKLVELVEPSAGLKSTFCTLFPVRSGAQKRKLSRGG